MLKTTLLIFLLHLAIYPFAQINIIPFEITAPTAIVQNSMYKNVQFIDTSNDNTQSLEVNYAA